jgi:dTDP-4-amino-4,6-dideoxygalactose transaminase
MRYAFLDVGWTYRALKPELDAAIARVMAGGWYIGGAEVAAFEAEFAAFCGAAHCVGLANGFDAVELPLRAAGIGPGDAVIVPAHTFTATWGAVVRAGARPVPVDVDPATMLMTPAAAAAAIGPDTAAILPVHLYGQTVDGAGFRALAARHGLFLLEDAAQAHGAADAGGRAGAIGDAAGFSFYPAKNLGAFGDAGAMTTADPALAAAVRSLGNYGAQEKYRHDRLGFNSRLDPLQAAMLRVKLAHLPAWTARRQAIAAIYTAALAEVPGLTLPTRRPEAGPGAHVWHLYVVRHPRRDALRAALDAAGVETGLHYPEPIHRSGAFAATHGHLAFPATEAICATALSLPIGPHLTEADAAAIAARVAEAAARL